MADQYLSTHGVVQQFPDKPAVTEREVSGSVVNEFTIRTVNKQTLVKVSLWPEFGKSTVDKIVAGAAVTVDGPLKVNTGNNGTTYYNLTARFISITSPESKSDREVVNSGGSEDEAPF